MNEYDFIGKDFPQFTLTLSNDNDPSSSEFFEIRVNSDHTVEIDGDPKPIEHARQLAQCMQMTFAVQNGEDKFDAFELYRNKLVQRAKDMDVKREFIDLLESDLFYYYLSGKEFDEE